MTHLDKFANALSSLQPGETFEFILERKDRLTIRVTANKEGYTVNCRSEWEFPTGSLITLINDLENLEE